ncbi:MAG TPA: O-acetyl-ADP-ribose deacetylase [Acidobacteriota bacterium]|nr:O-acetyl-ADP-ribose deacetylase [Acidobacteriota bacterium]
MMCEKILKNRIEIVLGDITQQQVDAIVNAANTSLLGGGGVDGAIHRAAGPLLLEECRKLHGCATGAAKQTKGYNLPATWIIHTVGPVWRGGNRDEDRLLADCYRHCLDIAREGGIRSIAFPAISTGVYGFPADRASRIAMNEIKRHLAQNALPEKVIIVCFDSRTYEIYTNLCPDIK